MRHADSELWWGDGVGCLAVLVGVPAMVIVRIAQWWFGG
jgi:hypothetical protein